VAAHLLASPPIESVVVAFLAGFSLPAAAVACAASLLWAVLLGVRRRPSRILVVLAIGGGAFTLLAGVVFTALPALTSHGLGTFVEGACYLLAGALMLVGTRLSLVREPLDPSGGAPLAPA
jgi:putative Ca2+/H+ antiporter (TMEM165/GDT1 family)